MLQFTLFWLRGLINMNLAKRGIIQCLSSKCSQHYYCGFGKIQNLTDLMTNLSYKSFKLNNGPRRKKWVE